MPWGLLVRLGVIVLTLFGLRRARDHGIDRLPRVDRMRMRRTLGYAREASLLALQTAGVGVTAIFAVISAAAALTLAGPGPHWVAVIFGAVSLAAIASTLIETVRLRHRISRWRHRRETELVIHEVDSSGDG